MPNYTLETENISAWYDREKKILYVAYRGVMTSDVTMTYYGWLFDWGTYDPSIVKNTLGSVYDFRGVRQFASSNISTATQQSIQANRRLDLDHIPVALITETPLQTQWVRTTMKIMPAQHRKRIVNSMDEAYTFFEEFHSQRAAMLANAASAGAE
jgi:hypothetical protein